MAIATVPEAIEQGQISIYLAANNNAKGSLFGKRLAAPGSPLTIAIVTDALNFGYTGGAETEQDLRQMANYLIWLTGSYGLQAQSISGQSGGGSVVPGGGSLPYALDWIVDATSSSSAPLADGDSSVYLDGTNGMVDLRGYNIDFFRDSIPQYTTNPGDGTTYYSWNRTTGLLVLYNANAYTGERMRISPTS